jgi:cyclophilin family peptidyl-prolyl cis-trans isomerase
MSKKIYILLILIIIIVLAGYFFFKKDDVNEEVQEKKGEPIETIETMIATIKTNKGDIKIELYSEDAPKTVENFVKLSEAGFYNETRFHRVIDGFMLQGGDPLSRDLALKSKWGTGGPGYTFEDEINKNGNDTGTIAMANAGPNTNGSQFFINTVNNNYLDLKHTVFGKVIEGMAVVMAIENVETNGLDQPIEDIIIEKITIQ